MARKNGIIALLTDLGLKDHYVGVMKGTILSVHPDAKIVDVSHDVEMHDITTAYFLLQNSYRYFPKGTIFVVVVDPGVGTERSIIGVETTDFTFLAPDNGVLGFLGREEKVRRIVTITNSRYFLQPVSNTFHGRDIFSPVAAHLAKGVDLGKMGEEAETFTRFQTPAPKVVDPGSVVGEVVAIDRFGNLITNITKDRLPGGSVQIEVGGAVVREISKTYGARKTRELLAYLGSSGALEIAINKGNAAKKLGVRVGDAVRVTKP
jgi:S-adenosyl-L-methionine hydrolase (adenosine-forming)